MGLNPNALPDKLRRYIAPESKKALGKAGMTYEEIITKAKVKSEKELQELCDKYLRTKGVRFTASSRMDKPTRNRVGTLDRLFAIRGIACAIELKFDDGKLSNDQLDVITDMRLDGWNVAVCWTIDEVIAFVKGVLGETDEQPHHD